MMESYEDQRPRRMSDFYARISARSLPESPLSLEAQGRLETLSVPWRREIGARNLRPWSFKKIFVYVVVGLSSLLGLVQIIGSIGTAIAAACPDEVDWVFNSIVHANPSEERIWPSAEIAGFGPVACLSHNDEWQRIPLHDALAAGCVSVEADVWFFNDGIYVGHSPSELTPARTLRSLYLDPILQLVQDANRPAANETSEERGSNAFRGIFKSDPKQSLIFLIDFKTANVELWRHLQDQLEPLRRAKYLTHHDGTALVNRPVTIVASGYSSFEMVLANNTFRDVFYDAPLHALNEEGAPSQEIPSSQEEDQQLKKAVVPDKSKPTGTSGVKRGVPVHSSNGIATPSVAASATYDDTNSYFASTSFFYAVGRVWGRLSEGQLELIRSHVREAHSRGLKARYWATPMWPAGLRNHVWSVLAREGVDILGIDDLSDATRT